MTLELNLPYPSAGDFVSHIEEQRSAGGGAVTLLRGVSRSGDDRIRNTLRRYKADDVITVLDDGRANFPANLKEGKAPIFGGARVG